ncbi:MAG: carbohydrate binding family 9 domain-containing protein, partial [Saprospiraceae bacterium]|nr:carbohydrate binding family 9 domain-containing protein [Saprospiraceae bacterium]
MDSNYVLHIRKSQTAIQLDGVLDEAAWQTAETAYSFRKQFPIDTGLAELQTRVQLTFDDKYLYVAALCYEPRADYTVQSLKRDFEPGTSDVLNFLFDPSKDGLNGFLFGVNPLNVQREALLDNGTNQSFDWDNKWNSAVQT